MATVLEMLPRVDRLVASWLPRSIWSGMVHVGGREVGELAVWEGPGLAHVSPLKCFARSLAF